MRVPLIAAAAAAGAVLLLVLAGPAYRMGVPLPTAFSMLRWGAYLALAAAACALIAAVLSYRHRRRPAVAVSVAALVVALVAFAVPFLWQQRARSAPPIHDITTDLENPPEFEAIVSVRADAPNTLERPSDLAGEQRRAYPDVEPITLPDPPDQVFDAALAVAQDSGWEIVTADRSTGRIEATDTTRWFGFKDDIVVRLTPWGAGTRVDVRSVSRVGRGDVGTNARRIRRFLDALGAR